MPLDSIGFVEPRTLSATATRLGITPVPRPVLNAHKAAEVAKYPGHWFAPYAHHYQTVLTMGTITTTLMFLVSFAAAIHGGVDHDWRMGVGFGLLAVVCVAVFLSIDSLLRRSVKIRGQARWREFAPSKLAGVPTPILNIAMTIRNEIPTATFVLGQLVQENIILDPYLIIRDGVEEAILGVWDDHGIIEIATVT